MQIWHHLQLKFLFSFGLQRPTTWHNSSRMSFRSSSLTRGRRLLAFAASTSLFFVFRSAASGKEAIASICSLDRTKRCSACGRLPRRNRLRSPCLIFFSLTWRFHFGILFVMPTTSLPACVDAGMSNKREKSKVRFIMAYFCFAEDGCLVPWIPTKVRREQRNKFFLVFDLIDRTPSWMRSRWQRWLWKKKARDDPHTFVSHHSFRLANNLVRVLTAGEQFLLAYLDGQVNVKGHIGLRSHGSRWSENWYTL